MMAPQVKLHPTLHVIPPLPQTEIDVGKDSLGVQHAQSAGEVREGQWHPSQRGGRKRRRLVDLIFGPFAVRVLRKRRRSGVREDGGLFACVVSK